MIPVFDGHNDFLMRPWADPAQRDAIWAGETKGHIDLPKLKAGGMFGGFFALFLPNDAGQAGVDLGRLMENPPFEVPLPPVLPFAEATAIAVPMAAQLFALERTGTLAICRTAAEIRAAQSAGKIAAILHMEGAEAIDPELDALYLWHALGLRSIGPVWSRPNAFGHGVPFAYPSTPDHGPGLTEAGKNLIRACNDLKILVDLSHLNLKGVEDVAALSTAPLMATHSNVHAISPSSRNLTDTQLRLIAETKGVVGLNYATFFLRPDGQANSDVPWEMMLRHLDHMLAILGEDGVALGSDFDGAPVPKLLRDAAGMQGLTDAMLAHGYGEALTRKIAAENWVNLFERVQGA